MRVAEPLAVLLEHATSFTKDSKSVVFDIFNSRSEQTTRLPQLQASGQHVIPQPETRQSSAGLHSCRDVADEEVPSGSSPSAGCPTIQASRVGCYLPPTMEGRCHGGCCQRGASSPTKYTPFVSILSSLWFVYRSNFLKLN
ncbi:hypothetical protein BDA96_02G035400 [Sorghum bicolor]|uniref:Uncharacterized protein n=1 Tax=Sorghum bicolor TaxID=4558 RepID=A0A921RK46_SORBI|nr:hypothetical protein BDA96_02G035400 [Sorghum bicolor]